MNFNRRASWLKSLEKLDQEIRGRLHLKLDENCHYTVDISHASSSSFAELQELHHKLVTNLAHVKRMVRPKQNTLIEA